VTVIWHHHTDSLVAVHKKTGRARAPADEGTVHRGRVGLTAAYYELCHGARHQPATDARPGWRGHMIFVPFLCVLATASVSHLFSILSAMPCGPTRQKRAFVRFGL
jgi:hypothetical protein